MRSIFFIIASLLGFCISSSQPVLSKTTEYDLRIARESVNITDRPVQGMTINGSIPGPTLYFKEGDTARIRVHNDMDVPTSIHWHGILLPNNMDGVPYLTYPPIQPGTTFTYEFPIRQSGTYWYHSHTNLQEQSGIYGSIVIDPNQPHIKSDQDHVILLSDWTDEEPRQVLRNLKRGSEWYSIQKKSAQSIFGAARLGMLGDYFKRELMRMPPMDISDVAYNRFLSNGKPEMKQTAKPGEIWRLRIINGAATTYFYLEFAGGPMKIVAADGIDVVPVEQKRILIGVAETYDVLIRIPDHGTYEFRATAHDGSGITSVWIGSGKKHAAPKIPKPNLYHSMGNIRLDQVFALTPAGAMGMSDAMVEKGVFDQPGIMPMDRHPSHQMDTHTGHSEPVHSHSKHKKVKSAAKTRHHHDARMQKPNTGFPMLAEDVSFAENLAFDGTPHRPRPPYGKLRAVRPTNFSPKKPIRSIRLTLDGDMTRYVWFFNNRRLSEQDIIPISAGEIVRFIMINRTMMHHPIHLHGHFFRVLNGQGDFAPLKHTVDVAPMTTTVIEFDADEIGDWFFHCHLLYHMKSGMARVIHYNGFEIDDELASIRPRLYQDSWYFWGEADFLSNMTQGSLTLSKTRHIFSAEWELGWVQVESVGWETTLTWDWYFNRFFSLFAGGHMEGGAGESTEARGLAGLSYLLPLNIESRLWVDSSGDCRIGLEKHLELTPRLSVYGDVEYDTGDGWEGHLGLTYILRSNFSLMGQWHSIYGFGAGLKILF
jgi:CopA family copper-resistance protein